jgi:serpin B
VTNFLYCAVFISCTVFLLFFLSCVDKMEFLSPFLLRVCLTLLAIYVPLENCQQTISNNDVDRLRQATDRFCLSLYQSLTAGKDSQNIFFSPLSINSALLMTFLGAENATKDELGKVLGVNEIVGTNINHLNRAYSSVVDIFKADNLKNYNLNLANRLCVEKNVSLKKDFQEILLQFYNSSIVNYDFVGNSEVSRLEINRWVSQTTNGKIDNLLAPGIVNPQTVLILVNAIYFKANWQYQFEKSATTQMNFFVNENQISEAKMMTAKRRLFYAENDQLKAQIVEIPYKSEELSMIILLPTDKNGINQLERTLNVPIWQSLQDQMDMRMVALTFPKFKLEASYDLVEPLKNLGISRLFGQADLGGISENTAGFDVSDIIHKSFVEVNEEGTEAAAATGVVFSRSAVFIKPDDAKEFRADHPFIFAIRHNPTNLILFIGRVFDPTLSS